MLNNVITWAAENRINFNFDKFERIKIQKSNKRYPLNNFLSIDEKQIVLKDTVTGLGVWCNFKMSWIYHISERLKKAKIQFNYIRRSSPNSLISSVRVSLFKKAFYQKKNCSSPVWFATKNQCKRIKTNVREKFQNDTYNCVTKT